MLCSPETRSWAARSSRCSRCSRTVAGVLIVGRADEEQVAEISEYLAGVKLRAGDSLLLDPRTMLLYEKLPRPGLEEVVLEEVPDVTYADIGRARQPDRGDHRRSGAPVPA